VIGEYEQKLALLSAENSKLRIDFFEEKLELQSQNKQQTDKINAMEAELKKLQLDKKELKLALEQEERLLEEKEDNFLVLNEEFREKLQELEERMANEKSNLQFKLKKYEEEEVSLHQKKKKAQHIYI
jgi:hypothetical protein